MHRRIITFNFLEHDFHVIPLPIVEPVWELISDMDLN